MKNHPSFPLAETLPRFVVPVVLLWAAAIPARAQTTAPLTPVAEEEILQLSPFEVTTSTNEGYLATSSLAGSRLKTDLKDIASPISVITPQFMQDTGARNLNDLLVYTTNTEVNGMDGNYTGVDLGKDGAGSQNGNLRNPQSGNRVRGLGSADITRNYFATDIPLDAYNTENIEIQRGPNAILFGLGSPAGIINGSLKAPVLSKRKFVTEFRVNSYAGTRQSLDANVPLVADRLGLRVNLLNENEKFRQKNTYADTARATGSLRWEPRMGPSVFTQVTVNAEVGKTDSSRPRFALPNDMFSSWFDPNRLNKLTTAVPVNRATVAPGGAWYQYGPYLNRDIGGVGEWFDQEGMVWFNPGSSETGDPANAAFPDTYHQRGGAHLSTSRIGNWGMIAPVNYYDNFHMVLNPGVHPLTQKATFAGDPDLLARINQMEAISGQSFTAKPWNTWQAGQITDPTVFDFWNRDLVGSNNSQYAKYRSLNLNAVQTYFDGKLGIEIAYDEQNHRNGHINWINNPNNINIDINQNIRRATEYANPALYGPEVPNPGFQRLVIASGTDGLRNESDRSASRLTAFYKLDAASHFKRPLVKALLGNHVFTGNLSRQSYKSQSRSFSLQTLGTGTELSRYIAPNEDFIGLHYLDTLANVATNPGIAGLGIQPITAIQAAQPGEGTVNSLYLDTQSVPRVPGYSRQQATGINDYRTDEANMYRNGPSSQATRVSNRTFIAQSKFFNDKLVGLWSVRRDSFFQQSKGATSRFTTLTNPNGTPTGATPYNLGTQVQGPNGSYHSLPDSPNWQFDPANDKRAIQTTRAWGLVVHSPDFINRRLPWGTNFSYSLNSSSNFRPESLSFDMYHQPNGTPSGVSRDHSFRINTLDGRLDMRVTWFKTVQKNASYGGGPSGQQIKQQLARTMNGLMIDATSSTGIQNTTPEWLVNKWFFGDSYDKAIAAQPIPDNWTKENGAALLSQPLRIRSRAVPGQPGYIAQGTPRPTGGGVYSEPPITEAELRYRREWFAARTDTEWFRPWNVYADEGLNLNDGFQLVRTPVGSATAAPAFLWNADGGPSGYGNTSDKTSKGVEIELAANITPNWRVMLNASRTVASDTNILNVSGGGNILKYYTAVKAVAQDGYTPADATATYNYWQKQGFAHIAPFGDNSREYLGYIWTDGFERAYLQALAAEGKNVGELRKYHVNLVTSYDFREGNFKGFGVGGAARWQDKPLLGFKKTFLDAPVLNWVDDLSSPIYGDYDVKFDTWVSYRRPLTPKVRLVVQLNVRNLLGDKELVAVTANPDGSFGSYRMADGTTWQLTTRFEF
ncbi:catecholate siderophore receptor Fiu [Lacunisphaera limnophila]|uniref:Catecholate siderophore receptor Fiu n=1 Tax=Lacunisphaera limnophila TaxID=1838286 RepID=A0A1D8AV77_9BACT|nr:TonB-dependent receptor plug domain-containing protein [Lacunisphaera limnophila]AOS44792.1 catecholate siderophore receptor Fiu [Lacunisphaera limnophila]